MEEPKSGLSGLFSTQVKEVKEIDPSDPRTWWAAYRVHQTGRMDVMAQMHDHSMHLAGVSPRKFYYDPRASVFTGTAVSAYYHLDSPAIAADIYNIEIEAMGGKMIYGEAMPTIDFRQPLVSRPADLDKVKPPEDWPSAGRVRFVWNGANLISEITGTKSMSFCAPFSMAVGLRSYPKLIRDMKRDPAFAHELFARITDEVLPSYLKAQADYQGVAPGTLATGADAWACYPDLTPELVEEWVAPYAGRLLQNCMQFGIVGMPIGSGDYNEEDLKKFDKQILWKTFDAQVKVMMDQPAIFLGMGRWHEYPLEPVVEWLDQWKAKGVRASITAGINARLLRDGPVEDIVDNVKRFLKAFAYDHNLTIFLANIPADTPSQHVHAAVEAIHCYGQLPLAEDLDAVQFEIPQRETFAEYLDQMSNGKGLQF